MHLAAIFSYGDHDYDNDRRVVVGSVQRTARSDHGGDLFSVFVEGGYDFDLKGWALEPFASLQYASLNEESFQETGAGSVSLSVDGRRPDSLTSELGLSVSREVPWNGDTLIPQFSAAWNYDFDIDDRLVKTSFTGSPNTALRLKDRRSRSMVRSSGWASRF